MDVKFNNDDFDFYGYRVMVLDRLKNGGPVLSVHLLINCSSKAFKILICCYKQQNGGQVQ